MKKYLLVGGIIGGTPTIVLILLYYLIPASSYYSYQFLLLSGIPANLMLYPIQGILPNFGIIGPGDVFGFIYLSHAIADAIIYSIVGVFIGWLVYKIKNRLKSRNTSSQNRF